MGKRTRAAPRRAACRGDHGPVQRHTIGHDQPVHALICCLALASLSRPCNSPAGPSPASIQRAFSLQPAGALSCIRTGQRAGHMSCMRSHLAACAVSGSAIHRTLWPWRPAHAAHLPRCDITSPPHRRHSIPLCESRKRRIALNRLIFVSCPEPPMVQTRPWRRVFGNALQTTTSPSCRELPLLVGAHLVNPPGSTV